MRRYRNDTAVNIYECHPNDYKSTIHAFSAHPSFNVKIVPSPFASCVYTSPLALCTPSLKLPVNFPLFSILVITSHMCCQRLKFSWFLSVF